MLQTLPLVASRLGDLKKDTTVPSKEEDTMISRSESLLSSTAGGNGWTLQERLHVWTPEAVISQL
jgi:hypothetical protein